MTDHAELMRRLRIKADMITMGERIEWGSDSAIMREAADALEASAAMVALADAAERIGEKHKIVQPLLSVYAKHGDTIARARAYLAAAPEAPSRALEAAAKAMERQIDYRFVSQKYDGWESFTDVQRRMFRAAAEAAIRAYRRAEAAPAPPDTAALVRAIEAVLDATRAYLPPDGIDAKAALSRVLAAVDNPEINEAMERAKGGA